MIQRPKQVANPDLTKLFSIIEEYFDHLEDKDTCEDTSSDMDHMIFDEAIEALYGPASNDYINERMDEIQERD